MSVPASVFISHSSPSDEAADWVTEFAEALEAEPGGVVALFDRGVVEIGERWREAIYWMLFECEAAVILLTPEALSRPWVLKEATILEARFRRDPGFAVVPVLLDGVTRETLERDEHWQLVQLSELLEPGSTDPGTVAQQVRNKVAPPLEGRDTPTRRLAAQIAAYLRDTTPDQCRAVLAALGERLPPDLVDEPNRLARAIAAWVLRLPPPALARVAEALRELGDAFPGQQAEGILKRIAPLWVDPEAAARAGDRAHPARRPPARRPRLPQAAHDARALPAVGVSAAAAPPAAEPQRRHRRKSGGGARHRAARRPAPGHQENRRRRQRPGDRGVSPTGRPARSGGHSTRPPPATGVSPRGGRSCPWSTVPRCRRWPICADVSAPLKPTR
jgi:hypothetical protein